MAELIAMRDVHKQYVLGKVTVPALNGITLTVSAGEFVCLAGPSGSGKSTFLNVLGGLDRPTGGSIKVAGKEIAQLDDNAQSAFRNTSIGFIFQSFNLIPVLDVFENVEFPLVLGASAARSPKDRRLLVSEMIEHVGLTDVVKHRPAELSGGQQQRVAIARALVTQPKIVLADELTANIDSDNSQHILALMRELNQGKGTTFIFATHDPLVMEYARRTVRLKDGRVVDDQGS